MYMYVHVHVYIQYMYTYMYIHAMHAIFNVIKSALLKVCMCMYMYT